MKTLMIVLGFALASCQSNGQKLTETNVPENLKAVIQQKFGSIDVDWEKEGENYEANFDQKNQEVSVLLAADGSIIEVEKEIKKMELPVAVQVALTRDFNGFDVKEAAVIESNGQISYEAEVKKGKESFDLIFDKQGNLIKKLSKDAEKD